MPAEVALALRGPGYRAPFTPDRPAAVTRSIVRERVTREDFGDAMEKILLGAERNITVSVVELERTAYHEAGHALLGMIEPGADPVRKVSIVPRGMSLGVTFQSAAEDRYGYDEDYLRGRIAGALGGRAAEQIIYGRATTGAEGDLEQVSKLARMMVGRWGMSDAIGAVAVTDGRQDGALLPGAVPASPPTQQLVDEEVRRIVDDAEDDVIRLLDRERERLDALAHALLERETLDQPEAYHVAGVEPPDIDAGEEAKATAAP